jgi:hypothetical protein
MTDKIFVDTNVWVYLYLHVRALRGLRYFRFDPLRFAKSNGLPVFLLCSRRKPFYRFPVNRKPAGLILKPL